jgi:hypothetical protein
MGRPLVVLRSVRDTTAVKSPVCCTIPFFWALFAVGTQGTYNHNVAPPWETAILVGNASHCTIPRFSELSLHHFHRDFKGRTPVIFARPLATTEEFRASARKEVITERLGDEPVILASSNSFSHGKKESTLKAYLNEHLDPVTLDQPATEVWYMFGDTFGEAWVDFLATYPKPMDSASDEGLVVWGLGGKFSGVGMHTHGAAFAEVISGRKRWYLSPPNVRPIFEGDKTQLSWVVERLGFGNVGTSEAPGVAQSSSSSSSSSGGSEEGQLADSHTAAEISNEAILECTAGEGEVLYIPPGWWHATLNLDEYNVFVSTFTSEKGRDGGEG